MNSSDNEASYSAWDPGLSSQIPSSLQPSITLFCVENSTIDYRSAKELSDFSGLKPVELVSFRIERLIVHDLLVRVTSDLCVPDGPNYEDLGISLRTMVHTIYSKYVLPEIETHQQAFNAVRDDCESKIKTELNERLFAPALKPEASKDESFFSWLMKPVKNKQLKSRPVYKHDLPVGSTRELLALDHWQHRIDSQSESDPQMRYCLQAIHRAVSTIVAHRGRMVNQPDLTTTIATNMALNHIGTELAHKIVRPIFKKAVEQENFHWLPIQSQPVVMNVKGASASGKSTIRPQQRQLAQKLDIPWEDFALISPDYWRKYLLDYDSLGADYKYAAMLTGQELEIVDKKLDQYMAEKASKGQLTHLLIDRFRFDSFNIDNGGHSRDSKLLSRFGDKIYLFFMITPPAETVVRAWERGQTTGRYKAVDDLLYHNIEAYTGMPDLFLSWVLSNDKHVHFEFLDNSVEKGRLPKTAAFGWNNSMSILDVEQMRAIEQFKKVDVDAKSAENVFTNEGNGDNSDFLKRCLSTIPEVKFVDGDSYTIYALVKDSKLVWWDRKIIEQRPDREFLETLLGGIDESCGHTPPDDEVLSNASHEKQYTLGHW